MTTAIHVPTYDLDLTMSNPQNQVTERQTLTDINRNEFNILIPRRAPFYNHSVSIIKLDTGETLVYGKDYFFGGYFQSMAACTKDSMPLSGVIIFADDSVSGEYQISYHTVGGDYVLDEQEFLQVLRNRIENPFGAIWEDIANKPYDYPPDYHGHHSSELDGYTDFIQKFDELIAVLSSEAANDKAERPDYIQLITAIINQGNVLKALSERLDNIHEDTNNASLAKINRTLEEIKKLKQALDQASNNNLSRIDVTEMIRDALVNITSFDQAWQDKVTTLERGQSADREASQTRDNDLETKINTKATEQKNYLDGEITKVKSQVNNQINNATSSFNQKFSQLTNQLNQISGSDNLEDLIFLGKTPARKDNTISAAEGRKLIIKSGEKTLFSFDPPATPDGQPLAKVKGEFITGKLSLYGEGNSAILSYHSEPQADHDGQSNIIKVGVNNAFNRTGVTDYNGNINRNKTDAILSAEDYYFRADNKRVSVKSLYNKVNSATVETKAVPTTLSPNSGGYYHGGSKTMNGKPLPEYEMHLAGLSNTGEQSWSNAYGYSMTTIGGKRKPVYTTWDSAGLYQGYKRILDEDDLTTIQESISRIDVSQLLSRAIAPDNYVTDIKQGYGKLVWLTAQGKLNTGALKIHPTTIDANTAQFAVTVSHTQSNELGKGVELDGHIRAVNVICTSDMRLKRDINPLTKRDLSSLQAHTYKMGDSDRRQIGLIAQDVRAILPEAVAMNKDGYLGVDYNAVVAALLDKVNELEKRIELLEAK